MSTWKGIIGRKFTANEFDDYVRDLVFTDWKPTFVVVHNTSEPRASQWHSTPGEKRMLNLQDYYRNPDPTTGKKAWSAGPHLFVADDYIWVFTPLTTSGVHSPSWNGVSWGVEIVGEFEDEPFDGGVRENAVAALATLHARLKADPKTLRFHKEDSQTTHKDCPGKNVDKADLIQRVIDRIPSEHDGEHQPGNPGLAGGAPAAASQSSLGTFKVELADGVLNVRSAPDATATKLRVLNDGDLVEVFAQSDNWCRIKADAEEWVAGKYLEATTGSQLDERTVTVAASPAGVPPDQHHIAQVDKLYEVYYSEDAKKTKSRDVPVFKLTDRVGLFHRGSMQIDVDGSPRAYYPKDASSLRLDDVEDGDSQGGSSSYIQGQGKGVGPRPGFFVSATSLRLSEQRMFDCDNFVDAENVPYFIHPPGRNEVNKGDVGIVVHIPTWKWTAAIFGDSNDHGRVSEASLRVAVNLGRSKINSTTLKVSGLSAYNGDDDRNYFYLYFPGSNLAPASDAPHWPEAAVKALAEPLFATWGGVDMVKECLGHI